MSSSAEAVGRIVIIGGGEAGARAAFALRDQGFAGAVTLVGAEAHAPYERPPLSKAALTADDPPSPATIAAPDRYAAASIDLIAANPALAIDRTARKVTLADGRALAYDRLLIATGATARHLTLPGAEGPNRFTLRRFEDAMTLRGRLRPGLRLAIIGGGFIGLEVAAAARLRGAEVTIYEGRPRLLERGVPAEIATQIEARHREAGVDFHFDARLEGFETRGDQVVVAADGREDIADAVLIGIGAVPATALAEAAGLPIDNGIAADAALQVADGIFAAGDCCSVPLALYGGRRIRLETWRGAQDHGNLAAANLLGGQTPLAAVPWFWSDQYDLTLQVAGLIDEGKDIIVRRLDETSRILFHLAADGRLVAAAGIGPGNRVAKDIRLAEMLIGRKAHADPSVLADPDASLKRLLAA